ncbi:transposase [Vibrio coralliilyticus]|uniref:transposase n=1 Tax=Vibrio coralliilyticus TaxID=190893 RepID=UPI001E49192C|nr:transposase [Vibrio coralliilyticus]MCC2525754.1 transposase [Vibrio coralliilyticus]
MSQSTQAKLNETLEIMRREGAKINPNAVAKRAGITTANLRHYPELHTKIKLLKEKQRQQSIEADKNELIRKQAEKIKRLETSIEELTAKLEAGSDCQAMAKMVAHMVEIYRAYDDVCGNAHDLVNLLAHQQGNISCDPNTGEILKGPWSEEDI